MEQIFFLRCPKRSVSSAPINNVQGASISGVPGSLKGVSGVLMLDSGAQDSPRMYQGVSRGFMGIPGGSEQFKGSQRVSGEYLEVARPFQEVPKGLKSVSGCVRACQGVQVNLGGFRGVPGSL